MITKWQRPTSIIVIGVFGLFALTIFKSHSPIEKSVFARTSPTPTPVVGFDQVAAIAKLSEQIKGREKEPASAVFKNVQTTMLKDRPAGQFLAVMEFGFARSLDVNCTYCHVPGKYEAEDKPQKQIAREMNAMVATLNGTTLKNIKNLKSASPTVNCTTCHRGEVKPALNLPAPK